MAVSKLGELVFESKSCLSWRFDVKLGLQGSKLSREKMIIKQTMKFEMSNLKRCKMEESGCDDEDEDCAYKLKPKRRKMNEYRCSYGGVEDLSSGSDYWSNERRHWATKLNSNLKQKIESQSSQGSKRHKPPLLKSLRGRTRMLPSRFNDAVLDEWRNKKFAVKDPNSGSNNDEFVEERVRSRKFDEIVYLERKFECGSSEVDPVCKREKEDDVGLVDVSSFDYRRYFDC